MPEQSTIDIRPYWSVGSALEALESRKITAVAYADKVSHMMSDKLLYPDQIRILPPGSHIWDNGNRITMYDSSQVCLSGRFHPDSVGAFDHEVSCPHRHIDTSVSLIKVPKGEHLVIGSDVSAILSISGEMSTTSTDMSYAVLRALRERVGELLRGVDVENEGLWRSGILRNDRSGGANLMTVLELLNGVSKTRFHSPNSQALCGLFVGRTVIRNTGEDDLVAMTIEFNPKTNTAWTMIETPKFGPREIDLGFYLQELKTRVGAGGLSMAGSHRKEWLFGPQKGKKDLVLTPGIALGVYASNDLLIEPDVYHRHIYNSEMMIALPIIPRKSQGYSLPAIMCTSIERGEIEFERHGLQEYGVWPGQIGFGNEGVQKIMPPNYLYLMLHFYPPDSRYLKESGKRTEDSYASKVFQEMLEKGFQVCE